MESLGLIKESYSFLRVLLGLLSLLIFYKTVSHARVFYFLTFTVFKTFLKSGQKDKEDTEWFLRVL